MMNELYKHLPESVTPILFGSTQNEHTCTETADGFVCPLTITDEEAELQLPGYALAFEEYHKRRIEGATPEEALEYTLKEWRILWRQAAFVPHRSS